MSRTPTFPEEIDIPKHVVIIPDGNRRWARNRNLPTLHGHRKGFNVGTKILKIARDMGIHTLTIWAFSTENWNRSKREVDYLMKLYEKFFDDNLRSAQKDGTRIYHLGKLDRIPKSLRAKIEKAVETTKNNTNFVLNIGLDYGGHDEILRALQKVVTAVQNGKTKLEEVLKEVGKYKGKYPYYAFKNYLDTADQPNPYPDLVIRTSGEKRLSGMLSWQACYAEIYWEKDHFPDFTPEKLKEAIMEYNRRNRRFGGNT